MKTLGRNADNDLYLEAGNLAVLSDADAQCAIIESVLQTQQGELQFDDEGGIDYFGTILQNPNNLNFWAAQVRAKIEALDFVSAVDDFTYTFDGKTGTLIWSMTVTNTDDEELSLKDKKTVLDSSPGVDVSWNDIYDKPNGVDASLEMLEAMRDEAAEVNELTTSSTLKKTKDTINQVVYDPNDPTYAATRQIVFTFVGVPLGTVIDLSNLSLGLKDMGGSLSFVPFTVELSDGTKRRNLVKKDGSALSDDGNDIWFLDDEGERTYKHTLTSGGTVTITIRGNITSIKSFDSSKPIFLNSKGNVFPYLSSITIGSRVPMETIGDGAFNGFNNLQTIIWNEPSSSTYDITFGSKAFANCTSLSGLKWVPKRLQSVGTYCFSGCKNLLSLNGLALGSQTEIPEGCFSGCSSLQNLSSIPETVTKLDSLSFSGCTSLTSLNDLEDNISEFGDECFSGCTGITTLLYFPEAITAMGESVFKGCTSLRSLFIPSTCTAIGDKAFYESTALTNVMCESATPPAIGDDTFNQEELAVYVQVGSIESYKTATGWKKYWDGGVETIYEYGYVDITLNNITENMTLLDTTSVITSDSIWQVSYSGISGKPYRYESTTTSLPSVSYTTVPTGNTSTIRITGFIKDISAVSDSYYPIVATTAAAENANVVAVDCHLQTSLERIGDYAFAQNTGLATFSMQESDTPFCLGARAFYGCSSLTDMGFLQKRPYFGRAIESITDGTPTYYAPFGEYCFYKSGITALDYPTDYVESLPTYCFAETAIKTLDGMESSVLTSLGDYCFYGCSKLTSIEKLANTGVTTLPTYCFAECSSLESIAGIEKQTELGTNVFEGCSSLTSIKPLADATSISELPEYCFSRCNKIVNLDGIDGIVTLGEACFYNCTGITTLKHLAYAARDIDGVPTYLTAIPKSCFQGCTGIKTLIGCSNIETIGEAAFEECSNLRSSSGLGENISSIGDYAFCNCGLDYFSCVASVPPTVSYTAFSGSSQSSINLYVREGSVASYAANSVWNSFANVTSRIVKIHYENITEITEAQATTTKIVSTIDDGDDTVSGVWYVDYGDGSDIDIFTAEDGETSMRAHTYSERSGYDVTLFGDITEIHGSDTTYDSTLHADPTSVSVTPFLAGLHENAASINVSSAYLQKVGDFCFRNYGLDENNMTVTINMASGGVIGAYAFAKTDDEKENGVIGTIATCTAVTIGDYAFYQSGLDSSAAFTSVTTAGKKSFAYNEDLTETEGFTALTAVAEGMFEGCVGIEDTTGLSAVEEVGVGAFRGCTGMTSVKDFGTSLTKIDSDAFAGCSKITNVFVAIETPPSLAYSAFDDDVFANAIVYVPVGTEDTYKATDYWSRFGSNIQSRSITFKMVGVPKGGRIAAGMCSVTATGAWTISYGGSGTKKEQTYQYQSGTTSLPAYTFLYGGDIEIKISGPVTSIASSSTAYPVFGTKTGTNTWLTSISVSSAMETTEFGDYVFDGCTALASVSSAPTITTIGGHTFANCTALSNIAGLSGVTSIGEYAFNGCSALIDLYGMHSVETIGERAFNGCSKLVRIDGLGANVTSIGANAFASCPLEEVQMFAEEPPTIDSTSFGGLDLTTVPLYVRTKSLTSYQGDSSWSAFSSIRSRYVEFTLSACPSNTTVNGGVGKVAADTFWMVDWDAYLNDNSDGDETVTNYLPEHTYTLSGNHTFRIEGAVTAISAEIDEITTNSGNGDTPTAITGNSFITLTSGSDSVDCLTKVVRSSYSTLETIGEAAFLHNENLETTSLNGVTSVGKAAFAYSGITSLDVLQSVTSVADYAFFGCSGLDSAQGLGGTKVGIGNFAFDGFGETRSNHPEYVQISITEASNATITDTSFGYYSDESLKKGMYVYVPMNSIAKYTDSKSWGKFTISSQVIEFTMENVPSGTTIIGISNTDSIGTASISASSSWTIDWGDGTTSTMAATDTAFPEHTYVYSEEHKGYWTEVTSGSSSTYYLKTAVISINGSINSLGCQSQNDYPIFATERGSNPYLTKVQADTSMDTLDTIGDYTFHGCTNLESVDGFIYVKSIGRYAFKGCTNLASVGDATTGFAAAVSIGAQAFADCTNLYNMLGFPNVKTIGIRAFSNCISLTGTTGLGYNYGPNGSNVTYKQWYDAIVVKQTDKLEFQAYAFEGCTFGAIDMENYSYPPLIYSTTFSGDPDTTLVLVQEGSKGYYQEASVWITYFANITDAAPISITFKKGEISTVTDKDGKVTSYNAIYGGNGRLSFDSSTIYIDWGDGTASNSGDITSSEGWTMPNHIYTSDMVSQEVTIKIRGGVTKITSYDGINPFIALSRSVTTYDKDLDTTTTYVGTDRYYKANMIKLSCGKGTKLQEIGAYTFSKCNISEISFAKPSKNITIGAHAFDVEQQVAGADPVVDNLSKITAEAGSICSVGSYAFAYRTLIGTTEFLNGCQTIGENAFVGCVGIADTNGLVGTVNIGKGAFYGCSGITAIKLPSTLESVSDNAFYGCSGILEGGITWNEADASSSVYSKDITIGISAFEGCTGGNNVSWSITIPKQVDSIGNRAFYGCGERAINLEPTLTSIGDYAFAENTNLLTVNWEYSSTGTETKVGKSCFEGCSSLKNVNGLGNVTTLPECCFFLCEVLSSLDNIVTERITGAIGQYCFAGCRSVVGIVTIPTGVTSLGEGCFNCSSNDFLRKDFAGAGKTTHLKIDDLNEYEQTNYPSTSVDNYGNFNTNVLIAQNHSISTTEFTIEFASGRPETKKLKIGAGCFMFCTGMSIGQIPALSDNIIPDYCFYKCSSLVNNRTTGNIGFLPDGVNSVGRYSFAYSGVRTLDRDEGEASLSLGSAISSGAFLRSYLEDLGTASASKATSWSAKSLPAACFYENSSLIDIKNLYYLTSLKLIDAYCFKGCGIKNDSGDIASLPASIRNVNKYAFSECYGMLNIPIFTSSSSTNITFEEGVFSKCTSLTRCSGLPAKFENNSLPASIFSECSGITTLSDLPSTVTTIGYQSFNKCSGLESLGTLPSTITTLTPYCFSGCSSLVEIGGGLKGLGGTKHNGILPEGCFENCTSLQYVDPYTDYHSFTSTVEIAEGVTLEICQSCFIGCKKVRCIILPYSSVAYVNTSEEDPFPDIPLTKNDKLETKKNAYVLVPQKLVKSYSDDAYWGRFLSISSSKGSIPVTDSAVTISVSLTKDGGKLVGFGTITAEEGDTAYIDWGDGSTQTSLEVGTQGVPSHDYEGTGEARTVALTIHGNVTAISGATVSSVEIVDSKTYSVTSYYPMFTDNSTYVYESKDDTRLTITREYGNAMFKSLTIEEGLKTIGSRTFSRCSALADVTSTATTLVSIKDFAFYYCPVPSFPFVESNIYELGQSSFSHCTALASIENLASNKSITSLPAGCFAYCSSLESIKGVDRIINYGSQVFRACGIINFDGVTFNESIVFDNYTFYQCSKLTSIAGLPSGLRFTNDIDSYAQFAACTSLTSMTGYPTSTSLNFIPRECFSGSGLTSLSGMPTTIVEIGKEAFYNCSYLSSLGGMSSNVKVLHGTAHSAAGYGCFACTALTNLNDLPASVETIEDGVFRGCTQMETLSDTISSDTTKGLCNCAATSLGARCFEGCTNLISLSGLPKQLLTLGNRCFYGCAKLQNLSGLDKTRVATLGNYCFYGCSTIQDLDGLPKETDYTIGSYCFGACTGLKNLAGISNNVTEFGDHCFSGCVNLASISSIPDNLSSIGTGCFYGCTSLRNLDGLQDCKSLTELPIQCFSGCTSLNSILKNEGGYELPLNSNITLLNEQCFYGCGVIWIKLDTAKPPEITETTFKVGDKEILDDFIAYIPGVTGDDEETLGRLDDYAEAWQDPYKTTKPDWGTAGHTSPSDKYVHLQPYYSS